MKTGIHNIDFSEYQAIDAVSNSYLGRLNVCPANALIKEAETPAMLFGSALHTHVLEGADVFIAKYAVAPECDRRTKAGKELWHLFEIANQQKQIISSEDYEKTTAIKAAILHHPSAGDLISSNGKTEQTVIWYDTETWLKCKGRIDLLNGRIIVDLKSTRDASIYAFTRSVVSYGYARQMAMYMEGLYEAAGIEIDRALLIACEPEPPYRVEVYELGNDFLGWGYDEFHRLMRLETECRSNKTWPHYLNDGIVELIKPRYLGGDYGE